MSNAELARAWFEEVWNQRKPDAIDRMLAPHAHAHHECFEVSSAQEFRAKVYDTFTRGVPDLKITVEDVVADDERAAVRWRATGTHRGELMGVPATGKPITINGMSWFTIRGGKLDEGWDVWSLERLMQSLAT